MAAYDPHESSVQLSNGPFSDNSDDQNPTDAHHLTPSHAFPHKEAHLTPSHAFPPTADSEIVDPEHARASSLSKSETTDSEEHHHHHAEKDHGSCASFHAEGKEPFQGHADREEGCSCEIGEGAVPTGIRGGNAGKGGSQHDQTPVSLASLPRGTNGAAGYRNQWVSKNSFSFPES
ncbi:hypothetical protein MMC28_007862 [Mycoblastus sanguinarius]|nr:hypothetical protein [Mycoblastus sanguinarius]